MPASRPSSPFYGDHASATICGTNDVESPRVLGVYEKSLCSGRCRKRDVISYIVCDTYNGVTLYLHFFCEILIALLLYGARLGREENTG